MKINITHTYPCDIESFWASWNAPEVREKSIEIAKFTRETLRDEVVDGVRIFEQRYISNTELPAVAQGLVGQKFVSYTLVSHIDLEKNTVEWTATPPALQEKIQASGTMVVVPHEDGCERIVEGDIKVGIPMLGKRVEKQIVEVLGKGYKLVRDLQVKWLKEREEA